jgi:hypothetical protein
VIVETHAASPAFQRAHQQRTASIYRLPYERQKNITVSENNDLNFCKLKYIRTRYIFHGIRTMVVQLSELLDDAGASDKEIATGVRKCS